MSSKATTEGGGASVRQFLGVEEEEENGGSLVPQLGVNANVSSEHAAYKSILLLRVYLWALRHRQEVYCQSFSRSNTVTAVRLQQVG